MAWRITKDILNIPVADYKPGHGKKHILANKPKVRKIYQQSKDRIKNMQVKYVSEKDPLKRAILEIYASIVSKSKYNEFKES